MRALLIAMAALSAAPALAEPQRCKVTLEADGLTTIGSVDADGSAAANLELETGPFVGALQIVAEAGSKGYSTSNRELVFHSLHYGVTLPEQDWRAAGSVVFEDIGFTFEWSRLLLNGKPVKDISIRISAGAMTRSWSFTEASSDDWQGVTLSWPYRQSSPQGFYDLAYGADELDALEYWAKWREEFAKRGLIEVAFTDKVTGQQIGVAKLVPLTAEAARARMVADVGALRAAYANNRCDPQ